MEGSFSVVDVATDDGVDVAVELVEGSLTVVVDVVDGEGVVAAVERVEGSLSVVDDVADEGVGAAVELLIESSVVEIVAAENVTEVTEIDTNPSIHTALVGTLALR